MSTHRLNGAADPTNYDLIKESIQHWFRMRKFYRRLPESDKCLDPLDFEMSMRDTIDEVWYARSCPLCIEFLSFGINCGDCPIAIKSTSCLYKKSIWSFVSDATNAKDWYTRSKKMVQLLWKLLLEERNSNG